MTGTRNLVLQKDMVSLWVKFFEKKTGTSKSFPTKVTLKGESRGRFLVVFSFLGNLHILGGGFKHFLCSPLFGEMIQIDSYFFKWVETTNSYLIPTVMMIFPFPRVGSCSLDVNKTIES